MLGDDWQWCPQCRNRLERRMRGDRPRPTCAACGFVFFAASGVGAAVVVQRDDGRVLLVQRGPGRFGAGEWCLPCGWVEWGEDVRDAARREAREEAGIDVVVGDYSLSDLERADEVFLTNAVRGIRPVGAIDGFASYTPGAVTARLREALDAVDA
jgi:8-oxo-dGTP pyrophosphatase MutT (NUDIX family)